MRFHNITKDDMLNGDGLRVVLWVSGCSHCCKECQNQMTWDPNGGVPFDGKAKAEVFEQLTKDYVSGITFSGGDPLHPANEYAIEEVAKEIKEKFPTKTIWLYTGALWESVHKHSIMKYLDVLVDGEFECDKKDTSLHWRGSANQRIIHVSKSLEAKEVVLYEENQGGR